MSAAVNENEKSVEEQQMEAVLTEKQQREKNIYNNFTTPLMGQFLNLPRDPVVIKCPSCGTKTLSYVENNMKWWALELNRIFGCFFVLLCCCCCFNYYIPFKQTDKNHYCQNCGCYFGRCMKHKQIRVTKK